MDTALGSRVALGLAALLLRDRELLAPSSVDTALGSRVAFGLSVLLQDMTELCSPRVLLLSLHLIVNLLALSSAEALSIEPCSLDGGSYVRLDRVLSPYLVRLALA